MRRSHLIWFTIGYLLLRWILAAQPGYLADVHAYMRWSLLSATHGLEQVYERSDFDYPPLYAYYLYPLGKLYGEIRPDDMAQEDGSILIEDTTLLTILIKIPPLLMDLLMALLLFRFANRIGRSWGRTDGSRWRWIVPGLYLLNPAVLFDGGFWGQPDSIHSFFVTACFLLLGTSPSAWPAWLAISLAVLMKPLGAPFLPLVGILSLAAYGIRRTAIGVAVAALTILLAFSPFLLTGRIESTLTRVIGDVGLMAYTSTNAHNFWWLLGSWQDSEVPFLGPITATQLGLGLFGILYLGLLIKAHKVHHRQSGGLVSPQIILCGLVIAFGFFMLSTHMHENHLFMAIPLSLPLVLIGGNLGRQMIWLSCAITLGVFSNLVLHDLEIPELLFSSTGSSSVENLHLKQPFSVGELWAIRASVWLNVVTFVWVLARAFLPGAMNWMDQMAGLRDSSSTPADNEV